MTTAAEAIAAISDCGRRAARWLADERGYTRVYVGGAPMAGLGSPKSDVDLFVVVDGQAGAAEQIEFEGGRVDVEFIQLATLRGTVDTCSTFLATAENPRQVGFASRSRLDSLTRFLLSEIIVDDGSLAELQEQLCEERAEYRKILIARHAIDVQNIGEDVEGQLLNEDLPGAEYQSRELLYRAAEAYLAANDDFYVNTKWLWAKWARTVGDDLGAEVRAVIENPSLGAHRDVVARNLWLAQDLVAMAASGYRYQPIVEVEPAHARRQPFFALFPTSDALLVMRRVNEAVSLSRQGVLLWGLSHGRTADEAIAITHKMLTEEGIDLQEDEVREYYDQLVQLSLVHAC
jgi:hypothetical protein